MISDLILETAKVVDINDPSKKGMIQINIESKMANIKKNLLPWAIPLFSDISNGTRTIFNGKKYETEKLSDTEYLYEIQKQCGKIGDEIFAL